MKSKKSLLVITLVIIVLLATVYSMRLKGQIFSPEPGTENQPSGPGPSFSCNPEATPPRFCSEGFLCSFGSCAPCDGAVWCNNCGHEYASTCGSDYYCEDFYDATRLDGPQIQKCRRSYEDGECSIEIFPYKFCAFGERCKDSPNPSQTDTCENCTAQWCNVCKNDDDCLSGYVCEKGTISAPTVFPQPESDFTENGKYKQCNRTEDEMGRECDTDIDCDGSYFTFCTDRLDNEYCYIELGEEHCFPADTCVQAKKSCVPQDLNNPLSPGHCEYLEPRAVSACTCAESSEGTVGGYGESSPGVPYEDPDASLWDMFMDSFLELIE